MNNHSICKRSIFPAIPCVAGTVRFSGGFSERNGRLEVCVNEEWATVCGKKLTQKDAAKACVQAGFSKEGWFIYCTHTLCI